MDLDLLFLKFLTRTATEKELSQLETLLEKNPDHRATLEKLEIYWQQKRISQSSDEDRIWKKLQEKTQPKAPSTKVIAPSRILRYAAVIGILIAVTISTWNPVKDFIQEKEVKTVFITKQNPVRLKRTLTLPDGTKVHLNSESKITYPNTFTRNREVRLVGEAYFEVVPDRTKPFKVICYNTSTIVEGTSFNVRGYSDDEIVKVSLVEGKVSIDFEKDGHISSYALEPMQEATFNRASGEIEIDLFVVEKAISWKDGILYFKNANYLEVKEKIERWYGVEISTLDGKIPTWNINGQFKNETMYNVMDIISHTENFTFDINDSKIEITL